jgi:hypothetical protein
MVRFIIWFGPQKDGEIGNDSFRSWQKSSIAVSLLEIVVRFSSG